MPREGELILSDFSLKLCLITGGCACFVFLASADDDDDVDAGGGGSGGSGGVNGWTGPLRMFAGELMDWETYPFVCLRQFLRMDSLFMLMVSQWQPAGQQTHHQLTSYREGH